MSAETKPAQFRLPAWAREFLVHESESRGVTRTDVVLEALAEYKSKRLESTLEAAYREYSAGVASDVRDWDATLLDCLEEEW